MPTHFLKWVGQAYVLAHPLFAEAPAVIYGVSLALVSLSTSMAVFRCGRRELEEDPSKQEAPSR